MTVSGTGLWKASSCVAASPAPLPATSLIPVPRVSADLPRLLLLQRRCVQHGRAGRLQCVHTSPVWRRKEKENRRKKRKKENKKKKSLRENWFVFCLFCYLFLSVFVCLLACFSSCFLLLLLFVSCVLCFCMFPQTYSRNC